MRTAIAVVLCLLAAAAQAQGKCTTRDAWTGPDKTKHFLAGAALGAAGTLATGNPHKGFALGTAVGAAKELADVRGWVPGSHTCSLQDFVVTAAGAAAGAYGTGWLVLPQRRGVVVAYVKGVLGDHDACIDPSRAGAAGHHQAQRTATADRGREPAADRSAEGAVTPRAYGAWLLAVACVNEFAWWLFARGTGEQGAVRYVTTWALLCAVLLGVHLAFRDRFLSAVCAAIAVMASTTAGCSAWWLLTKFELQPGKDQCSKTWGVPMLLVSAVVALAVFWRWRTPNGK